MNYYEFTRNPNIFKDTNWGSHEEYKPANLPSDEIVKNRNGFIEQHNIVCVKKFPKATDKRNVDHSETYEDEWGWIVHVYSQHPMCWREQLPMYKTIKPIYALNLDSKMRKYETAKSKKILMNDILRDIPDDVAKIINSFLKKCR